MARLYAQLFTLVFAIVGIGGLILGDAGHIDGAGNAGGNLGGITLHLSWLRDILDLLILGLLVYVGFVAARRRGRLIVGAVGLVLTALAVAGFVIGDDAGASKGFATLHFPLAINVFDLIAGLLGLLAALGTIEEPGTAA